MKGTILIIGILMGFLPMATAQTTGVEFLKVPDGSIGRIDTRVEFTVENWGLEKVFVAIPQDWKVSDTGLLDGTHRFGGTAYPVRFYATRYWKLWGLPSEKNTPMGRGEVYSSNTAQDAVFDEVAGRQGWYLKPNEAIKVVFDVKDISINGGMIDPLKLESENPDIRVVRWYQRFILNVTKPGFITAPWVVIGANLTEASPAPYSDAKGKGASKYYVDFETTTSAPEWDRWVQIRQPLSSAIVWRALGIAGFELPEIKKIGLVKPVFKVDNYRLIQYAYEWERGKTIEGWRPWRNDFSYTPAWHEWF